MDNIWNKLADDLYKTLLENGDALILHFIRTAPEELLAQVAGENFRGSGNTLSSVKQVLAQQLTVKHA